MGDTYMPPRVVAYKFRGGDESAGQQRSLPGLIHPRLFANVAGRRFVGSEPDAALGLHMID